MLFLRDAKKGLVVRFSEAVGHGAGEGTIEKVYGGSVMVKSPEGLIEFKGTPYEDEAMGPDSFLGLALGVALHPEWSED